MTDKSHFIIGGAPRSGTTWLYHALDRHPDIYMAKPVTPEPKFFLVDDIYAKGLAFYKQNWFSDAPPNAMTGEKSTNYLESSVVAQRIHQSIPDAKLVFILRNPVERAFNNYLWSVTNGMEDLSFEDALEQEEQREKTTPAHLQYARPHAYYSRGLYAKLLKPYFQLFTKEQILCIPFENLERNPTELLNTLHEHLKVELRPQDANGLDVINKARDEDVLSIPDATRRQLEQAYSSPNKELAALLGGDLFQW